MTDTPVNSAIRVLLVEDNPGDARLVQEFLEEANPGGFRLTNVERISRAREVVKGSECDVVLLDLSLPDSSGIETFRKIAALVRWPIVVLTGTEDAGVEKQLMGEGAFDYLPKRHLEGRLLARILRNACAHRSGKN